MERAIRAVIGCLLCGLLVALWPQAAAPLPVFGGGGTHNIFFEDAEEFLNVGEDPGSVDGFGNPTITVGDKFYGILNAQSIKKGAVQLWGSDNVLPGIDTVTGYFVNQVTGVTTAGVHNPSLGTGQSHIDFGPVGAGGDPKSNPDLAPYLALGAIMAIYADDSGAGGPGTPYGGGTILSDYATATDGLLLAVLGITADGGYSYAHGPTSVALGLAAQGWLGLRFLYKHPSLPGFMNINDPAEFEENQDVQFYAQTEIKLDGSCGDWTLCTNDPAVVRVSEPAGLFSFGLMLVGLGLFSRRMLRRRA